MIYYYSERAVYSDMFIQGLESILGEHVLYFDFDIAREIQAQDVFIIDGNNLHPQRFQKLLRAALLSNVIWLTDSLHDFEGVTVKLPVKSSVRGVANAVRLFFKRSEFQANIKFKEVEEILLSDLAKGASNKEMARSYDLPLSAVKYNLQNIYTKMGVSNRTQAALKLRETIL